MKTLKLVIAVLMIAVIAPASAQKKKVAVVTFYADKMIDFKKLDIGGEELLKNVLDLRDNPNFNLAPMLEKFHHNFFNEYSKAFPFELLPESEVTNDENYKNFQPKFDHSAYDARNYLVYDGYKYVYEGMMGKYNEEGMAKAFAGKADGVMFVYIGFGFEKGFGIGNTMTLKMRATTRMALYNAKGEKVFAFYEGENSKKTAVMVQGIPVVQPEKILPMCESALTELMGDLNKRLAKIVTKSENKL
jgi:hypothetical protein